MKLTTLFSLFSGAVLLTALPSLVSAHFQMIHADGYLRDKGGKVTLNMPFTHPSHGAPMMEMATKPLAFTLHHRDKNTDLNADLQAVSWSEPSGEKTAQAWQAETKLRRLGDYVFSLTPVPYYEESEEKYIQQFTKVIYNVGGLPTNWDQPTGAPFEIIPDLAPYAVYAGGLFSGTVLVDGKPYPNAEIEVEYLNHAVNTENNGFVAAANITYPNAHMNIQTIKSDAAGRFMFVPPVAGYWGFAALDLDNDQQYEGKELSQDAVLWIQAHELAKNPSPEQAQ
ncbi:MAG: DUF4198 domain-containing protein [Thiolinea sp.]